MLARGYLCEQKKHNGVASYKLYGKACAQQLRIPAIMQLTRSNLMADGASLLLYPSERVRIQETS